MQEGNIRTDVDNIDYQCRQFEQFKDQSLSHGLLSPAQLHEIMKNVLDFYWKVTGSTFSGNGVCFAKPELFV